MYLRQTGQKQAATKNTVKNLHHIPRREGFDHLKE
jgi:hypothetical protein